MAYRTSESAEPLATAFRDSDNAAIRIKRHAQRMKDSIDLGGSISASRVLGLSQNLLADRAVLLSASALSGIGNYVKDEFNDPTYVPGTEFTALLAAIDGVTGWISSNFPVDGSGYLLQNKFDVSGALTDRTFTVAQLSGLATLLDTLIASVD